MKKKIIVAVVMFTMLVFLTGYCGVKTSAEDTISEANIPSETYDARAILPTAGVSTVIMEMLTAPLPEITVSQTDLVAVGSAYEVTLTAEVHDLKETTDIDEINELIAECENRLNAATQMREACIALGYADDDPVIQLANDEYSNAEFDLNYYTELLQDAQYIQDRERYPAATAVWDYLTQTMGLNDRVAAGILGNMMAEVGGQTLDLQVYCDGRGYYGICQWRKTYYEGVIGGDVNQQLDYLAATIEDEFANFSWLYKSEFTYEDFKQLNNEQDAALAFACVYERCGEGSHYQRQLNATDAYNYYVR